MKTYPLFDYLRMVLALGVFASHADRSLLLPAMTGDACVQVFFALSGFLIGGILLETPREDLPRFFFNRVTRVWIPYLLAVAIIISLSPFVQPLDAKFWEFAFYQLTFTYNQFGLTQNHLIYQSPMHGVGNVFWSVCVEEQFYLVAPLVICFLPRARLAILAALVALNFVRPHSFAAISLGVLLAMSVRRWGPWFERPALKLALAGVVAALLALMWLDWSYQRLVPWTAVAVVALVAYRGERLPLGVVLGGMSYPFYLNHWMGLSPRLELQRTLSLGLTGGTALALAVALAVALVHFKLVDSVVQARRSAWYRPAIGRLALLTGWALVAVGLAGGSVIAARARSAEVGGLAVEVAPRR